MINKFLRLVEPMASCQCSNYAQQNIQAAPSKHDVSEWPTFKRDVLDNHQNDPTRIGTILLMRHLLEHHIVFRLGIGFRIAITVSPCLRPYISVVLQTERFCSGKVQS